MLYYKSLSTICSEIQRINCCKGLQHWKGSGSERKWLDLDQSQTAGMNHKGDCKRKRNIGRTLLCLKSRPRWQTCCCPWAHYSREPSVQQLKGVAGDITWPLTADGNEMESTEGDKYRLHAPKQLGIRRWDVPVMCWTVKGAERAGISFATGSDNTPRYNCWKIQPARARLRAATWRIKQISTGNKTHGDAPEGTIIKWEKKKEWM